jgi:hypothetical protein
MVYIIVSFDIVGQTQYIYLLVLTAKQARKACKKFFDLFLKFIQINLIISDYYNVYLSV